MTVCGFRGRPAVAAYRGAVVFDDPFLHAAVGDTPLVRLSRIAAAAGGGVELYAKFEGANPTGSFKDRGMSMAVTMAVDAGSQAIICASTGNTSAAAAASWAASRPGCALRRLVREERNQMDWR